MITCNGSRVGLGGELEDVLNEYGRITDAMCRVMRDNEKNGMNILRRVFENAVRDSVDDKFIKNSKTYESFEEFERDMLKKEEEA